jgi:hypothetical protein
MACELPKNTARARLTAVVKTYFAVSFLMAPGLTLQQVEFITLIHGTPLVHILACLHAYWTAPWRFNAPIATADTAICTNS